MLGNPAEAVAEFDNIPQANRDHPNVLALQWRISEAIGNRGDAWHAAFKLCELLPDCAAGWICQANSLREIEASKRRQTCFCRSLNDLEASLSWPITLPATWRSSANGRSHGAGCETRSQLTVTASSRSWPSSILISSRFGTRSVMAWLSCRWISAAIQNDPPRCPQKALHREIRAAAARCAHEFGRATWPNNCIRDRRSPAGQAGAL